MQAVTTLKGLANLGLVEKVKHGYTATAAGMELIALADKERRWMKAPSIEVTNVRRK